MSLVKSGILVSTLLVLTKLTGFFRVIIMARFIDPVELEVWFNLLNVLSLFLILFDISTLGTSFLSVYSNLKSKNEDGSIHEMIMSINIISSIITLLFLLLGPIITYLLFYNSTDFFYSLVFIAGLLCPNILMTSISSLSIRILHYNNNYLRATLSELYLDVLITLSILLFSEYDGLLSIVIGYTLSGLFKALTTLSYNILHIPPSLTISEIILNFKSLFISLKPILILTYLGLLINLTVGIFAVNIYEGGLTYIVFSQRLRLFPEMIIILCFRYVIYPKLVYFFSNSEFNKINNLISSTMDFIYLAYIPIILFSFNLRDNIIYIIYYGGEFNDLALSLTTSIFLVEIFFMLPNLLVNIFREFYYSQNKTYFLIKPSLYSLAIFFIFGLLSIIYQNLTIIIIGLIIGKSIETIILSTHFDKQINYSILNYLKNKRNYIFTFIIFILITQSTHEIISSYYMIESTNKFTLFIQLIFWALFYFLIWFLLNRNNIRSLYQRINNISVD